MVDSETVRLARVFHALHRSNAKQLPLLVANAWDGLSARAFARAGAQAIATTSAGMAATFGYPDGGGLPRDLLVGMVRAMCRAVRPYGIPVSVDCEAGYGETIEDCVTTMRELVAVGAVGINLEDAVPDYQLARDKLIFPLYKLEFHVAKIRAIRAAMDAMGMPLFINARTDVFLANAYPNDSKKALDEAVRRVRAYVEAGADGIFVPGPLTDEQIKVLVQASAPCALNVLAGSATSVKKTLAELQSLGVRRVSVGSAPSRDVAVRVFELAVSFVSKRDLKFSQALPFKQLKDFLETPQAKL